MNVLIDFGLSGWISAVSALGGTVINWLNRRDKQAKQPDEVHQEAEKAEEDDKVKRRPKWIAIVIWGGISVAVFLWAHGADRNQSPFRDCPECPKMVVIEPGSFTIGSPREEDGHSDDESPQMPVTIANSFALGVYEVTFDEWNACAHSGGCGGYMPESYGWGEGRRPVINVGWQDAKAYVSWLSRKTGEEYRLPSEAEWEYAARAGTKTARYWGPTRTEHCRHANGADQATLRGEVYRDIPPDDPIFDWNWCDDGYMNTAPVGTYLPNAWGLHDMLGNVWEWTEDCWHENYEGGLTQSPRLGDVNVCSRRVARGGDWGSTASNLRSAKRRDFAFRSRYGLGGNGFRVARICAAPESGISC